MVERESKPSGASSPLPPHQSTESGIFLKAVIPEVESNAALPFGTGHSNQSGVLPGVTGAPAPPSTPPTVEPPASSGGSVVYHLEPPPPVPPLPTYPEPEDPPVLPRAEIPPRRTNVTPVPPSRIPTARPSPGGSSPPPSRLPDLDHDYSKPLLVAYSVAATIIILVLLIRNAIIGLIEGS